MTRRIFACAAFACAVAFTVSSFGQIIYEPVRYQYGAQQPYYYGGSDPQVFARAERETCDERFGRTNGWSFASGNVHTHREVVETRPRIYSDCVPGQNAWVYGYTADDAANAANANVPRYYRKRDLLLDAAIFPDGSVVVPPQAGGGTIDIRRVDRAARIIRSHVPAPREPRPLLIIPKEMWESPLKKAPDKSVVVAPAGPARAQG